jgi:small subunit ribosomal protein S9
MTAETKKTKKTAKAVKSAKKTVKKKTVAEEEKPVEEMEPAVIKETAEEKKTGFLYAVGRRKQAIAAVKLHKNGKGKITVNGKLYSEYFPTEELEQIVSAPLKSVGQADKVDIEAKVLSGGKRGQAEAVRLGISRALVLLNINFKKNLRKAGFLTRDPRVKERKKPGLKRARRAPQWQKR